MIFKKNSEGIVSSSTVLAYVSPLSMAESTDIKNHKNNKTLSIKRKVYLDLLLEKLNGAFWVVIFPIEKANKPRDEKHIPLFNIWEETKMSASFDKKPTYTSR